jgi:hypothetical protein
MPQTDTMASPSAPLAEVLENLAKELHEIGNRIDERTQNIHQLIF